MQTLSHLLYKTGELVVTPHQHLKLWQRMRSVRGIEVLKADARTLHELWENWQLPEDTAEEFAPYPHQYYSEYTA